MPQSALRLVLTPEERDTLTAWSRSSSGEHRLVERSNIILLAAEGLSAREIAPGSTRVWRVFRSGGNGSVAIVSPGLRMRRDPANRRLTPRSQKNESLHYWIQIHRMATASGTVVCWRQHWVTSATIRSGEFCAGTRFSCSGGGVGASRPIRSSDRRRPMLWDCI